jgi:hypothetical protein
VLWELYTRVQSFFTNTFCPKVQWELYTRVQSFFTNTFFPRVLLGLYRRVQSFLCWIMLKLCMHVSRKRIKNCTVHICIRRNRTPFIKSGSCYWDNTVQYSILTILKDIPVLILNFRKERWCNALNTFKLSKCEKNQQFI